MPIVAVCAPTAVPVRHGVLLKWLLLPLLLAGVVTFHVLSDHEPGSAQHVLGTSTAAVDAAVPGIGDSGRALAASAGSLVEQISADGSAPSGPHQVSACDVFLNAVGGSVLLLLLGWALTGDTATLRSHRAGSVASRGPPLTGRPRLALCVNRT